MTATLIITAEDACSADATHLMRDLSAELARRYDFSDDGVGDFRAEDVTVPRGVFLIGRLGGQAIACGAVRPLDGDVGELKRMYVAPAARGRGLARQLLAALEETACRMGYATLRLETGERQPESIRLYEAAGYHRIAPYGHYANDPRSVAFEKRLLPGSDRTGD
jgi:GNAT superfamily N-acetyltransferase